MSINVNVTNAFLCFFHHKTQYLSYLNKLDYHSDYTSIKYKHLEKKEHQESTPGLNSLVARAISKK